MAGLSLLFYPDVASWWNDRSQRGIAQIYDEEVARLRQEQIDEHFRRAAEVNASLSYLPSTSPLFIAHMAQIPDDYHQILYVGGVMGRISIPKINVNLPIYHTTSSWALDRGVGHLEGTAFPTGGYSTHSVLTAHTGLANARMFTDLEHNVTYGDLFFINVLGQTLAYEVDQILTVLPHEIESLRVVPGEDLVTLITCTPYALNSHRLLVRGRRIPYIAYMAEEIEQIIISTRVDIRIFIFVGLFASFMLVFGIYNALKGRNVRQGPRPVRNPRPIYTAEAQAANPYRNYENDFDIGDLFRDLENRPKPNISANTTKGIARFTNKTISPPKPRPIATRKRKPANRLLSNTKRNIAVCSIVLLLISGVGIAAAQATGQSGSRNGQSAIADFVARIEDYNTDYRDRWVAEQIARWIEGGELEIQDAVAENPLHWLYQRIAEHNHRLYEAGQGNLPDPFGYTQDSFNLNYFGFDEEMIGFISISSIDLELPIYMGASRENLQRGLAHVTNTSLPVGGTNTNAVIAGHIGSRRANLPGNINELSTSDVISITNFYETITYAIVYVQQYGTTQRDTLAIQSGRDMLTLIGYQQGSQRYVIIAERINAE